MAIPSVRLIRALRKTAAKLKAGSAYQWGHMGACNCGNLAQTLTKLTKADIHAYAMERSGDWAQQILEFCPTSGYPMDVVIQTMLEAGLTRDDLTHLERLDDPWVLAGLPLEQRHLARNRREDAVLYMEVMADRLEAALQAAEAQTPIGIAEEGDPERPEQRAA